MTKCIRCLVDSSLSSRLYSPSSMLTRYLKLAPRSSIRLPSTARSQHTGSQLPSSAQSTHHDNPADTDPNWISLAERDPVYMRSRRKHGPGILLLALIPITAFALGTWQIQRLKWKSSLIAKLEDQLVRDPMPLPDRIDVDAIPSFDHRKVVVEGSLLHGKEMLIGPRMRDGADGYIVVTPLDRGPGKDQVLISRGWIEKGKRRQSGRDAAEALPKGRVRIEGLLRAPFKKNSFTPDNKPEFAEFYFPDVEQMASISGSQPVWIEEIMEPELMEVIHRQSRGMPIGRSPTVQLHNSHAQYIATWYGLGVVTSIMFWMVFKKRFNSSGSTGRVRKSQEW